MQQAIVSPAGDNVNESLLSFQSIGVGGTRPAAEKLCLEKRYAIKRRAGLREGKIVCCIGARGVNVGHTYDYDRDKVLAG